MLCAPESSSRFCALFGVSEAEMKSTKSSAFDRLGSMKLPLRTWPAGATWYRIHRTEHEGKWFGPLPGDPPAHRFDDPLGKYRVCYLGATLEASFAETLLRTPPRRLL